MALTGKNVSAVQAEAVEFWVTLCEACEFASEPEKFDRPKGTIEAMRHRLFGDLNPTVTMEPSFIKVKFDKSLEPLALSGVKIPLRITSTCKNCGADETRADLSFSIAHTHTQPQ